jgi:hypothetical protein
VLLARTEALDEVEAAAEQRFAAALARERAELDKQARSQSCTRGAWLHRLSPLYGYRVCMNVSETAVHATRAWQHGTCDTEAQPE